MLLGTLGASLSGNLLTGGKGIVRAGEGVIRAGEGAKKKNLNSLLPFHPLTNFEISEYYKNEPRFDDLMVYILEIIYQKQLKKERMK